MIDPAHPRLSIARQCRLVAISRSAFYEPAKGESPLNQALMRLIDEPFLETPWYGSRQMARQPEAGARPPARLRDRFDPPHGSVQVDRRQRPSPAASGLGRRARNAADAASGGGGARA